MWSNCFRCRHYDELRIYCRLKGVFMGDLSNNRICPKVEDRGLDRQNKNNFNL